MPITILSAVRRCQTIVASPNDKFFLHNECQDQDDILCTVDENIIATTKIRNNYGAIQSFKFPIYCDTKLYKNKAKRFRAKVGRAIIKWGGIEKSQILR